MKEDMKPDTIRLMDATGLTVLDSVDCEYEDSFCLETFGDLVKAADEESKAFIIARVQTWDHKQPDRAFYSYYHAHHLNKLLFQTQVYLDKKLIHRLHVLNPLTNTDIIGNVLYFICVPQVMKEEVQKTDSTAVKKSLTIVTGDSPSKKVRQRPPPTPTVKNLPSLMQDTVAINRAMHHRMPQQDGDPESPSATTDAGWTLAAPLTARIDEEDEREEEDLPTVTSQSPLKSSFTKAPAPVVQVDVKAPPSITKPSITFSPDTPTKKAGLTVSTGLRLDTKAQPPKSAAVGGKQMSPTQSFNPPLSAYPGGSNKPLSSISGKITRHGEPMTPIQALSLVPPSARNRRRQLSFMNSVESSGSYEASVEDWRSMRKEDAPAQDATALDAAAGKYDQVKPFGGPMSPLRTSSVLQAPTYYDAILLATDSDFLEQSRIRAVFRENAVAPSDAVLFEMPAYTGAVDENRSPHGHGVDGVPLQMPCDVCFPTEAQLNHPNPVLRAIHQSKCYIFVVFITIAIVSVIFLVSRQA